jgi:transposase-like protein
VKKIKPGNRRYPKSLKRKIAEEYLSGKFSYAVAAEEYGLKNKGVVKEFVKWHKKSSYLEQMKQEMPIVRPEDQESTAQPPTQDQLLVLQEQLAAAKLKIAALETLIDLAEENLQIDIRKKSGTKQSAK